MIGILPSLEAHRKKRTAGRSRRLPRATATTLCSRPLFQRGSSTRRGHLRPIGGGGGRRHDGGRRRFGLLPRGRRSYPHLELPAGRPAGVDVKHVRGDGCEWRGGAVVGPPVGNAAAEREVIGGPSEGWAEARRRALGSPATRRAQPTRAQLSRRARTRRRAGRPRRGRLSRAQGRAGVEAHGRLGRVARGDGRASRDVERRGGVSPAILGGVSPGMHGRARGRERGGWVRGPARQQRRDLRRRGGGGGGGGGDGGEGGGGGMHPSGKGVVRG